MYFVIYVYGQSFFEANIYQFNYFVKLKKNYAIFRENYLLIILFYDYICLHVNMRNIPLL